MPLQHVAWKTYAKTGEMMSKRFEELQAVADDRIISYRDYPVGTDNERLAGLLCRRVLDAERFGAPYVLELPRRTIALAKWPARNVPCRVGPDVKTRGRLKRPSIRVQCISTVYKPCFQTASNAIKPTETFFAC